jgi:uncharacterized protein YdeI (YjbR/CyaY-like superfamily)
MNSPDARIDDYISKAAPFAKPILSHLRKLVHRACPEVEETWKWSFPHFVYSGSILCSMASFKQHCSFGFWLGALMKDPEGIIQTGSEKEAMGHFGQIKTMQDLPPDNIIIVYIKEAVALIDSGAKLPKKEKAALPVHVPVPGYFLAALKKNKKALAYFDTLSPSHKKEYAQWIEEAKSDATREKRMATTLEWLEEGKQRNWKYQR